MSARETVLSPTARIFRSDDLLGDVRINKDDMAPQLLARQSQNYAGSHCGHGPIRASRNDACQHAYATAFQAGMSVARGLVFMRHRRGMAIATLVLIVGDCMLVVLMALM